MDTGTLIVAAVFMAICIVPFFFIGRGRRKMIKEFKKLLHQMADNNKGKLSYSDFIGNFGIGIDEFQNIVYFVKNINGNITNQEVSLGDYKNCKMNVTSNHFDGGEKVVVGIKLEFINRDSGKPEVIFNLYNEDSDSSNLVGELQAAEKWERILKSALKKAQKTNAAPITPKAVV